MKRGMFRKALACICLCIILAGQIAVPARAAKFKDVPAGFWAASEINRCVELGFFKGQKADRFGVGSSMSRASFAVVLSRFFGWQAQAPAHSSFLDVPAGAWYAAELQAAYEHGAITRQSNLFRPNDPITREEIAVALVRALGYSTVAASTANDALSLRDVTTNRGYIAMTYELGLVSGYQDQTFRPTRTATREQVAVMLIRMYDKLHQTGDRMAFISKGETLTDLDGIDTVVISAAVLNGTKTLSLSENMSRSEANKWVQEIHAKGGKALLGVTGTEWDPDGDAHSAVATLVKRAQDLHYDGVYLNIDCKTSWIGRVADLAAEVRNELPEALICAAVDAPAKGEKLSDYQNLSQSVNQIVVRVTAKELSVQNMPVAVMEPLEDIYAALAQLRKQMPAEKLVLQITTTGSAWNGTRQTGAISGAQVQELLNQKGTAVYQSEQYCCSYLQNGTTTVWYLGGAGVAARAQLVACLGAQGICLTSLNGVMN